jgi:hypothetical protein
VSAFGLGFYRSIAQQLHKQRKVKPSLSAATPSKQLEHEHTGVFGCCARVFRSLCGREAKVDTRSMGQIAFDAGVDAFLERGFRCV